jgi:hypothetical protein
MSSRDTKREKKTEHETFKGILKSGKSMLRGVPSVVDALTAGILKIRFRVWAFKSLCETVSRAMADTVELFMKKTGLTPLFVYIFSDEINFLFMGFQTRTSLLFSLEAA